MGKWCVIVVPGANRRPMNWTRDLLADNLLNGESMLLEETRSGPSGADDAGRVLTPDPRHRSVPFEQLDLVEAYWADLMPNDGETQPLKRLTSGLRLASYWIADPRIWRAIFSASWFIVLGYVFSAAVLLAWTASLVLTAAQWIGPAAMQLAASTNSIELDTAARALRQATAALPASWLTWAQVLTVALPLLSLVVVIDLARLTLSYLEDEQIGSGVGLRARIRQRLRGCFRRALDEDYERIIVVAHSFGTLPLIDLIADWPDEEDLARVQVITLGSPAGIFAFKSPWVRQQVEAALVRELGFGWTDFKLKYDFWCSGLLSGPRTPRGAAVTRRKIDNTSGLLSGVLGELHMAYFRESAVLGEIVRKRIVTARKLVAPVEALDELGIPAPT